MEELKIEKDFKTLPKNRKVDRWLEAMVSENIWHQWVLAGTVESL